jgi:hypothetical protein
MRITIQFRANERRGKVRVPPTHLFGLVADPGVNHPLMDALACAVADETVAKDVPALQLLPLAA